MYSSSKYWPDYWDYEAESRARARSVDRLSRARSVSPVYRTIRSVSAGPSTQVVARSSSPVISSYDVTKPYYRNYLYLRTSPESFYYTPSIYSKSYLDYYYPRYYSRYDYYPYLSPYYSRYYYNRYYSPSTSYFSYRYPYSSSYLPLSVRYPYLYSSYY